MNPLHTLYLSSIYLTIHPSSYFLFIGVIFYQKGDSLSAIPYIELALQSNNSHEGFHNSLGNDDDDVMMIWYDGDNNDNGDDDSGDLLAMMINAVITVFVLSPTGVCYRELGRIEEAEHQFKLGK